LAQVQPQCSLLPPPAVPAQSAPAAVRQRCTSQTPRPVCGSGDASKWPQACAGNCCRSRLRTDTFSNAHSHDCSQEIPVPRSQPHQSLAVVSAGGVGRDSCMHVHQRHVQGTRCMLQAKSQREPARRSALISLGPKWLHSRVCNLKSTCSHAFRPVSVFV
jgi:hypothetical protein